MIRFCDNPPFIKCHGRRTVRHRGHARARRCISGRVQYASLCSRQIAINARDSGYRDAGGHFLLCVQHDSRRLHFGGAHRVRRKSGTHTCTGAKQSNADHSERSTCARSHARGHSLLVGQLVRIEPRLIRQCVVSAAQSSLPLQLLARVYL
jgi:hypothetical protein